MQIARAGAAFLLTLISSVSARGQNRPSSVNPASESFAGVMGVAVDSIHGGPLKSAVVTVEGLNRRVQADLMGRFQIDRIPPGRWRLTLSHPVVDSIGYDIATPPLELIAGRVTLAVMATPSSHTLRELVCPGKDTSQTRAVLLGMVREADTDIALSGAQVSLVYTRTEVSKTNGIQRRPYGRVATSGPNGMYVICGLPSALSGTVQASLNGTTTAEVPVTLSDELLSFKGFAIGVPAISNRALAATTLTDPTATKTPNPSTGTTRSDSAGAPRSGRAIVTGHVYDRGGAAVAGARVAVVGTTRAVLTAADGSFTVEGLPSGTSEIVARKIGFAPASAVVELTWRQSREVNITLTEASRVLDPINVRATIDENLARTGYSLRRQQGVGRFFDAEDIQRRQPVVFTDIFRSIPGFRVTSSAQGISIVPTRSQSGQSSNCVNVFVDNAQLDLREAGDLDRAFTVDEIAAIETYPGSLVPPEFAIPARACATIVVWTKTKIGEQTKR